MKQDRKPEYHSKNADCRIVSRPNGLWVAQHKLNNAGSNQYDDWKDLHRGGSYELALQVRNIAGGTLMRYMQNPINPTIILHCSRAQAQSLARYQWVRVEWTGCSWVAWKPRRKS